jgi:hypothetical protein
VSTVLGKSGREIPDPSGFPPLCEEDEFAEVVAEMVADEAPRLYAIVAEFGERVDAKCAAWVLAFKENALVFNLDGTSQRAVADPEDALRYFAVGTSVRPRLVLADPSLASPVGPAE